jgi:protein TonB
MIAEYIGENRRQSSSSTNNYALHALVAAVLSLLVHVWVKQSWHVETSELIPPKQPLIMEVELVPPPEPEPVVEKIEPPKPKLEKPKKQDKPKVKPVPKPKPIEKTKPEPKAPPKVKQKTYKEAAPTLEDIRKAIGPVPVFSNSKKLPETKSARSSSAVSGKPAKTKSASGQGNDKGVNSGVALVRSVKPKYPMRALSRHLEGRVTVQFTVNASGQVESPSVVSASPSGIFEEAALAAIRQFKFKPKMVSGKAVSQRATQTINFKLNR